MSAAAAAEHRVRSALARHGLEGRLLEFPAGATETSTQAAAAIGCELGQVVKSLVLLADDSPVLCLVAGDRLADRKAIAAELGARRSWLATPEQVVAATGYEVGGVSPFDPPAGLAMLADDSLRRFTEVFPAGGTSRAMVRLSLEEMLLVAGAKMARISREP